MSVAEQSNGTGAPRRDRAISVVVCTYNRADVLGDTLRSFFQKATDESVDWELVVVNNNSTDHTGDVINEFEGMNPHRFRAVFEPESGLSVARNTGIREAAGRIIAFADDDVYFGERWVNHIADAFEQYPEAWAMGGRTSPHFEGGRPEWLTTKLAVIFGCTNSGDRPKIMEYPEHPFGVNMAFRRQLFDRVGGFQVRLGRRGKSLLSNEEADMFRRVAEAGLPVVYWPDAFLEHRIPRERTEPRWALSRYYWQGVSEVVNQQVVAPASRLQLLREIASDFGALRRLWLGRFHWNIKKMYWHTASVSFENRTRAYYRLGKIRQAVREVFSLAQGAK